MTRQEFTCDPIVKFQMLKVEGDSYSVAIRKSGKLDLYKGGTRKDSPSNVFFTDFVMTFEQIFLKQENGEI